MSRIIVLANHYNTLRVFRKDLLIRLSSLGNEVLIAIPECDPDNKRTLESYGCEVRFIKMERRGMNPIHDIGLFRTYYSLIKEYKPDKVICYTIKCNIYGAYACKKLKVPCYVNVTGLGSAFQSDGVTRKLVSFMYRHSINKAKKVFFENAGNRDTLVDDRVITPEQAVVMKGAGVNIDEFPYKPYPSEDNGIRFLTAGRLMREKGTDELLEAIKYICNLYPNTIFELIGWYEDEYMGAVEKLQQLGYIHFSGWQLDVAPYYESCHCVVHPSWHEGMSNTLLEGASTGRPLITNSIHGCKEAVDDGVNGFLCEKQNTQDLIEKLERFILLTHEEKEAMGRAGREKMVREFNKIDVVEKTLKEIGEG